MPSKKRPQIASAPKNKKKPESTGNPLSYLSKFPVWSFKLCDTENEKWSIRRSDSLFDEVISKLISFEGLTWNQIQTASGGKSQGHGTNSHFENISEMSKEAQNRATELKLDVDQLFSLRLTGKMRLYGILDAGIFRIIWLDREHEIYPVSD